MWAGCGWEGAVNTAEAANAAAYLRATITSLDTAIKTLQSADSHADRCILATEQVVRAQIAFNSAVGALERATGHMWGLWMECGVPPSVT